MLVLREVRYEAVLYLMFQGIERFSVVHSFVSDENESGCGAFLHLYKTPFVFVLSLITLYPWILVSSFRKQQDLQ